MDEQFIIITGGGGFIGRHIVSLLNQRGFSQIVIVEDLKKLDFRSLAKLNFIQILDYRNSFSFLEEHKNEIKAIIHMGANSDTTETDFSKIMEENYFYSIDLVNFAIEQQIRFIYASSASIYGDGQLGFDDNPHKLTQYTPLNQYGFTKYAFDLYLTYSDFLDRVLGFRFFNVFGSDASKKKMASLVTKAYQEYQSKGSVTLFDVEAKRDFVYVEDAARYVVDLIEKEVVGIYNLGTEEPNTFDRMVALMFDELKVEPKVNKIPLPEELKGRYQYFTQADMKRFKEALLKKGLKFTMTPFDEAVKKVVGQLRKKE